MYRVRTWDIHFVGGYLYINGTDADSAGLGINGGCEMSSSKESVHVVLIMHTACTCWREESQLQDAVET